MFTDPLNTSGSIRHSIIAKFRLIYKEQIMLYLKYCVVIFYYKIPEESYIISRYKLLHKSHICSEIPSPAKISLTECRCGKTKLEVRLTFRNMTCVPSSMKVNQ
jgi:hypothetical protein